MEVPHCKTEQTIAKEKREATERDGNNEEPHARPTKRRDASDRQARKKHRSWMKFSSGDYHKFVKNERAYKEALDRLKNYIPNESDVRDLSQENEVSFR